MDIYCESILKKYNQKTVLNIDELFIPTGKTFGIIGFNGSGKTTLLSILAGILDFNFGKILYDDSKLNPSIQKEISLIFQEPMMLNTSVINNIIYPLKLRGMNKSDSLKLANEALQSMNLSEIAEQNANTLSGGEKQKVAILRGTIFSPKLLLLDEPTTNIDPVAILEIENYIKNLEEVGRTIIIVTHNIAEASRICSDILLMDAGKIIDKGKTSEIIFNPANDKTKFFINMSLPNKN